MPNIASVLEPKLAAIVLRIDALKTRLGKDGAYPGMTKELAEIDTEMYRLSGFAELLVVEVRGFAP